MKFTNGFLLACLAVSAVMSTSADTYYWIGAAANDDTGKGYFINTKAGKSCGWSLDASATNTPANHTISSSHDYVIPSSPDNKIYPRVPATTSGLVFAGRTIKLYGQLPICSTEANPSQLKLTVPKIIGAPYTDRLAACISPWVGRTKNTVIADFQVDAGEGLSVRIGGTGSDSAEHRDVILGDADSTFSGAGTLYLAGNGSDASTVDTYVELMANASNFTGTVANGFDPSGGPATGPKNFVFYLSTASFAGTVTDFPTWTKAVIVNYDALPTNKALRVATTTVPAELKTKLTFWSPTADFTKKNFPLLTFPAGTGVSTDEFTIYYRTAKTSGTKTAFTDLGVQINADSTMTLMANYEGAVIEVNSWTTEPTLSKSTWMASEDEPGVVTPPVAKYGAETMTATLNDVPWDGTMPTAVGQYTLTWSVAATASYTGISISRSFEITPYVDPVNSQFRYLPAGGQYWKHGASLNVAYDNLPAAGGIIELNVDDVYEGVSFAFRKQNVIVRSSTHPSLAGRRFRYRPGTYVSLEGNTSVVISNLIVVSSNGGILPSGGFYRLNSNSGARLTLGDGFEFSIDGLSSSAVEVGAGCSVRLEGFVCTNCSLSQVLFKLNEYNGFGASLTIGEGARICGNKAGSGFLNYTALLVSGAVNTVLDLYGGVMTNNVISEAATAAIASSGKINIKGSPVVWDNRKSGAQANILPSGNSVITLRGDMDASAKVGVSRGSEAGAQFGVCGTGAGDPVRAFVCDANPKLYGAAKSGVLRWKEKSGLIFLVR